MTQTIVSAQGHPSSHRDRVGIIAALFGVFGGPFAWALQLNINYALASHACFPHAEARSSVLPGWHGFSWALGTVDIVALGLSLAAAVISWRSWQSTREEHHGGVGTLLEAGEGRTRFLAICGLMSAFGFAAAILFNLIAVLTVPPCMD
jgi:hypothetical protein